ncbi:MAG TPA: YtxH domain-containing protein [Thermomicrobiales bacterium]|nr:YtxH domain-containing protein [Thermomicrobiales bacterium]
MIKGEESRHDLAFMAGVIVGAISGALAALALTPMSGAETREKLRETTSGLAPVKEKVASSAGAVVATGKEKAAGAATAASHAVATGKDKAAEMAAKSPLPVGQKEAEQDVVVREDVPTSPLNAADTGFGGGEHAMDPAEGSEAAVEEDLGKPPAGSRP